MSARSGTAVIALRADRSARSGSQRAGRFVVRCTLADSQVAAAHRQRRWLCELVDGRLVGAVGEELFEELVA